MSFPTFPFSVENGKVTKQDIIDFYKKFGMEVLEVEFVQDTILVKLATPLKYLKVDFELKDVKVNE